jgi:hypothetical protein
MRSSDRCEEFAKADFNAEVTESAEDEPHDDFFVGDRKKIALGVHEGYAEEDCSDARPLQRRDTFL